MHPVTLIAGGWEVPVHIAGEDVVGQNWRLRNWQILLEPKTPRRQSKAAETEGLSGDIPLKYHTISIFSRVIWTNILGVRRMVGKIRAEF